MGTITQNNIPGLQNKEVVLITGASAGLGKELALLFAKDGYDLLLISRNEVRLLEVKDQILSDYNNIGIGVYPLDLSRRGAAKEIFDFCESNEIIVNTLVNNAGFAIWEPFFNQNPDDIEDIINVHVLNATMLTYYFGRKMKEKQLGKIIQIASTAAFQSGPYMSTYFATKGYLLMLSEAIQTEKGSYPRIQIIAPGPFDSEFKERAKMEKAFFFNRPGIPNAMIIAKKIYKTIGANKSIYVNGVLNNTILLMLRLFPRKVVNRVIALFLAKE